MVAETLAETKTPQRGKIGGYRQTIPLPVKLKIRSLYIIQQLSPAEIGEKMGMTRQQVQGLCYREKWQRVKQRAKISFQQQADARAKEEVSEIHDAFALKTEELAMGSLEKASRRMPDEDVNAARDLQALSQTAKNFIGIARQIRGMDSDKRSERGDVNITFIGTLERVGDSAPKRLPEPAAVEVMVSPILNNPAPESPGLT